MTPSEGFEAWFYPKGILGQYIKFDSEMARKAWLAACAWQKQEDLEWVMAHRRDCGCADKIAAAIRAQEGT